MQRLIKEYKIKSYECDQYNFLRIRSLFNIFQDGADINADELGFGYKFCVANNLTWVGTSFEVQINKLPSFGDEVVLETWPSVANLMTAYREFILKDKSGLILVKASSSWALIDVTRRRPVSLQKTFGSFIGSGERAIETDFKKMQFDFENPKTIQQIIREDDLDINLHVNNAVYPSWVLDAVSQDFVEKHFIQELKIQYKQSAQKGDDVYVKTSVFDNNLSTSHTICSKDKEFAKVLVKWGNR